MTLTKVNNSQYTIDLTTVTATDGHYVVTVNAAGSGILDADGNLLAANTSVNWDRGTDTTQPTVTLPVVTTPRMLNAGVLRFEFSEPVTQVSNANFTLTRDVGAGPVNVPITAVPTTITPDANFNGRTIVTLDLSATGLTSIDGTYVLTLTTTVAGLSIRDAATAPNTLAGAATRTVSWVKQRGVDVLDVSPDPRIGAVSSVTVRFSEQVARVQLSDFSMTYDDLSGNGPQPVNLSLATLTPVSPISTAFGQAAQQWTINFANNQPARDGNYNLTFNDNTNPRVVTTTGATFTPLAPFAMPASDTWTIGENAAVIGDLDVAGGDRPTANHRYRSGLDDQLVGNDGQPIGDRRPDERSRV